MIHTNKNRTFLKNIREYRIPLCIIELSFLLILTAACVLLFHMVKRNITLECDDHVQDMISILDSEENRYEDEDLRMASFFEQMLVYFDSEPFTNHFGITVSLYDTANNPVTSVSGKCAILYAYFHNEKEDEDWNTHAVWFNLYDYFDSTEVDAFIDLNNHESSTLAFPTWYVSYINGYYDSDHNFIPTELEVCSYETDTPFHLGEPGKGQPWYISDNTSYPTAYEFPTNIYKPVYDDGTLLGDAGMMVDGSPCVFVINANDECSRHADKLIQDAHDRAEYIRSENIEGWDVPVYNAGEEYGWHPNQSGTIEVAAYTDVSGLTVDSPAFKLYAAITAVILQLFAILFMCIYVYWVNRQRKLTESRNLFINAMAHELKTPAAAIQNTAEYLQTGNRPEKQSRYLEILQQEAGHINDLLGQILTYTRVSEKAYPIHLEKNDLYQLAKEIIRNHEEQIAERDITVEWNVEEHDTVQCDTNLINMVIDNFISNAIKYGTANGTLHIMIRKKELIVCNDGSPLTAEEQEKIWTPMYRADKSRTDSHSSGMGLAISAGILDWHHATYGCENREKGVAFYFSL